MTDRDSSVDTAPRLGFAGALLVGTVLALVGFKWTVMGRARLDDLLVGTSVEIAFLAWLWLVREWLMAQPRRGMRVVANGLYYAVFYFTAGMIFAYTFYFDSAVERRFSLLDIEAADILYFAMNVLPPRGFVALSWVAAAAHAPAWWLQRAPLPSKFSRFQVALLASTAFALSSAVVATSSTRVATPLFDIAADYVEFFSHPAVPVDADTHPFTPVSALDKSASVPKALASRFKKIVVLVMETMTVEKLERERAELRADTFFVRERAHFHELTHYFPNNQDSRTGLLDITGSRLIPYEAYSDADLAQYEHVKHARSLVSTLEGFGYQSAFAFSQVGLEPVISELGWDAILRLSEADRERARDKYLCFTPYEFEHGCEDLVVLPQVVDFLAGHERAFVFQEFIWGHASEYNEASGRSNADYYSSYIDRLLEELRARELADETLLVVTADHGFRDKGHVGELWVYRIPLWFYAPSFSARSDDRLLSHTDFKDLLFEELEAGTRFTTPNDLVFIVGPTGTHVSAALTRDRDFMVFKSRGERRLLLEHTHLGANDLPDGAPRDPGGPARVLKLLDEYRERFARLGPTRVSSEHDGRGAPLSETVVEK